MNDVQQEKKNLLEKQWVFRFVIFGENYMMVRLLLLNN